MCFVGIALLTHRRLFDPRIRANSSFGDTAILLLLFAQLMLGLCTIPVSLGHLDGHEMVKFMSWAQGILTLQPGVAAYVAGRASDLQAASVARHDDLPACSRSPASCMSGARRSGISAAAAIRSCATRRRLPRGVAADGAPPMSCSSQGLAPSRKVVSVNGARYRAMRSRARRNIIPADKPIGVVARRLDRAGRSRTAVAGSGAAGDRSGASISTSRDAARPTRKRACAR